MLGQPLLETTSKRLARGVSFGQEEPVMSFSGCIPTTYDSGHRHQVCGPRVGAFGALGASLQCVGIKIPQDVPSGTYGTLKELMDAVQKDCWRSGRQDLEVAIWRYYLRQMNDNVWLPAHQQTGAQYIWLAPPPTTDCYNQYASDYGTSAAAARLQASFVAQGLRNQLKAQDPVFAAWAGGGPPAVAQWLRSEHCQVSGRAPEAQLPASSMLAQPTASPRTVRSRAPRARVGGTRRGMRGFGQTPALPKPPIPGYVTEEDCAAGKQALKDGIAEDMKVKHAMLGGGGLLVGLIVGYAIGS